MSLIRIGEFAANNGVTKDFIRLYEKEGALTSIVDADNNYHYYDFSQSITVFKIKYYRRLGFSVNEILQLLNPSSQEEQIILCKRKAEEQQSRAEHSYNCADHLNHIADILSKEEGTWYIVKQPAFWFLPHTENGQFITDSNLQKQLVEWEEQVPFVYSIDHWLLNDDGSMKRIQHGRGIAADVVSKLSISTETPAVYCPEMRCLEYFFSMNISEKDIMNSDLDIDSIKPAVDVLHSLNLELGNNVFIHWISFLQGKDSKLIKCAVYIPC